MKKVLKIILVLAIVLTGIFTRNPVRAEEKAEIERLYGANRYRTSLTVAEELKDVLEMEKFSSVVLTTGNNFADALSGAYLANTNSAPVILINENSAANVQRFLRDNLEKRGNVYVLGGENAVPSAWLGNLKDRFSIIRLEGSNRYGTNINILNEVEYNGGELLVCTGNGFADSLSASAVDIPILLVNKTLNDEQKKFLKDKKDVKFIIIGGEAAVSNSVAGELVKYGSVERVYGDNRYETSAKIAERFFDNPEQVVLAYGNTFPDGLSGGPLAFACNAPLLLVNSTDKGKQYAVKYTANNVGKGYVLGGSGLIDDKTAEKIIVPVEKPVEPSVITLDMSTLFIVPNLAAVQKVEDQLNDYLTNTLHETFTVNLKVTAISDYFSKIPMELARGGDDAPDLVQVFTMEDWVDNGYLMPIDKYLDKELKPTVDLIRDIIKAGKTGGHTYMIPRYFGTVLDWKFIYNKDMVDAAGVDVSKIHDIDTLGDILAELKAAYPEEHFLVYCDQFNRIFNSKDHTAMVGTYAATVGESTKLYNYYETEAFKKAINKAYEFRQKGYADPEGSANNLTHDAVVMSGSSKGVIMGHSADTDDIAQMFTRTNSYGATFGAVSIGTDDLSTDTLGIGIAHYCKDPAAAARFINLLYTDEFVWNTIIYGAEGQDYVWNEDHTKVRYPDGLDFNSVPYNCVYSCGMIGNGFFGLEYETDDGSGSDREYGKWLMDNAWCPPLYGFTPTTDNVMNEITAVSNVVEQYSSVLMYGDVDPAVEYPKFLDALKTAGIDKIIADFQAQADEWVKENK